MRFHFTSSSLTIIAQTLDIEKQIFHNTHLRKIWHENAWEEYLFWQHQDSKTLRRINQFLQSIDRNGPDCIGNPEPLRNNLSGWWSVRINQADRLVFRTTGDMLEILACKGHYN